MNFHKLEISGDLGNTVKEVYVDWANPQYFHFLMQNRLKSLFLKEVYFQTTEHTTFKLKMRMISGLGCLYLSIAKKVRCTEHLMMEGKQ